MTNEQLTAKNTKRILEYLLFKQYMREANGGRYLKYDNWLQNVVKITPKEAVKETGA